MIEDRLNEEAIVLVEQDGVSPLPEKPQESNAGARRKRPSRPSRPSRKDKKVQEKVVKHRQPHATCYKRRGIYYIQYWANGIQTRFSTKSPSISEARLLAEELQVDLISDYLGIPRPQRRKEATLGEVVACYRRRLVPGRVSDGHIASTLPRLDRLLEMLGGKDRLANEITTAVVDECMSKLYAQGFSPKSISHHISALKACFHQAREDRSILEIPFKVKRPKVQYQDRIASLGECRAILAGVDFSSSCDRIMAIALLTGFRLGDILALKWRDIDWERGFITITTGKTQIKIVMPIHPRLYEWLTQAKKSTGTIVEDNPHRRWTAYVGARTLALSGARYTPHTLRHTFASNIKDDIQRQRLLGHTSLATTKIYTHFSLEEYEQEVGGLYQ